MLDLNSTVIIVSPTKKQKEFLYHQTNETNLFSKEKNEILNLIQEMDVVELKNAYKISETLANKTFETLQNHTENTTALFTYSGEVFSTLDPYTLNPDDCQILNNHLVILSALYGVLLPFDTIGKYRLDFLTKLPINLYTFWSPKITEYFNQRNQTILNLASEEFSTVLDHEKLNVDVINVKFLNEKQDGSYRVVSSHAKKARGAYVRYIIEHKPQTLEEISVLNYEFSHCDNHTYVYIKKAQFE